MKRFRGIALLAVVGGLILFFQTRPKPEEGNPGEELSAAASEHGYRILDPNLGLVVEVPTHCLSQEMQGQMQAKIQKYYKGYTKIKTFFVQFSDDGTHIIRARGELDPYVDTGGYPWNFPEFKLDVPQTRKFVAMAIEEMQQSPRTK